MEQQYEIEVISEGSVKFIVTGEPEKDLMIKTMTRTVADPKGLVTFGIRKCPASDETKQGTL